MPIDPSIALGVQQVKTPNMLAEAGQAANLQTNMMQNAAIAQEMEGQNALRKWQMSGGDINAPDAPNQMLKMGVPLKAVQSFVKTGLEQRKLTGEVTKQDLDITERVLGRLANDPSDGAISQTIGDLVKSGRVKPEEGQSLLSKALLVPMDKRPALFMKLGTDIKTQYTHSTPSASALVQANATLATKQESEFQKTLGKGQAEALIKSREAAQDAAAILQTNRIGKSILDSGAITGSGADFFVGLNQALKTAGIDAGYADAAANSQAYGATMASNVGKLIKQYGAGTGLSDADREFATKAAAGSINMDEKAIRKVLDINDRAARNIINEHNKKAEGVKTNIPLKVETPGGMAPMYATNGKERIVSNDGGATWQPVGAR